MHRGSVDGSWEEWVMYGVSAATSCKWVMRVLCCWIVAMNNACDCCDVEMGRACEGCAVEMGHVCEGCGNGPECTDEAESFIDAIVLDNDMTPSSEKATTFSVPDPTLLGVPKKYFSRNGISKFQYFKDFITFDDSWLFKKNKDNNPTAKKSREVTTP
ncbi:hypothetical protein AVEN_5278-1 [Araneus ventricosus]|uniref:Uncharacterized protein n=1 Tax=Araneus ventricosus TaxID=182803 RepID=A0A4Y2CYA8_ARAVE|nr:hypothetical protein AVEN_5278-1 [Araneus ventricosus]